MAASGNIDVLNGNYQLRIQDMKITIFAGMILTLSAGPVFATGGFSCEINDNYLELAVGASFSYSLGGLLNPNGYVKTKIGGVPESLRNIRIDDQVVGQHWLDGKDLRLELRAETVGQEPFSQVKVTILTSRYEIEVPYIGTYELNIQLPTESSVAKYESRTGNVVCNVE